MKAIVKLQEGNGFVDLIEKEEPAVSPGNIKIKVEAAGICGTDLKIRSGDTWSNPPVVLCHEFSGTVAETGEGVTTVKPGDRVISETAQVVCGKCEYCMTGNYLMCPSRLSIGYGVDGAFANYIVVREGIIHRIPEGVSFDEAAMCEPLAVAVHAVYDSVVLKPTDRVVVMGPGTIGLLVGQIVKSFGSTVLLTGTDADQKRLQMGKSLGFDYCLNVQKEDLQKEVNLLTGNKGADYVFDCSGAAPAIQLGFSLLKRKGTLIQIGLTKPTMEIPYASIPQKEISIKGTFGHNWLAWEIGLELLKSGKVRVKPLISKVFPMKEWQLAFDMAQRQEGIKILIHPNE